MSNVLNHIMRNFQAAEKTWSLVLRVHLGGL